MFYKLLNQSLGLIACCTTRRSQNLYFNRHGFLLPTGYDLCFDGKTEDGVTSRIVNRLFRRNRPCRVAVVVTLIMRNRKVHRGKPDSGLRKTLNRGAERMNEVKKLGSVRAEIA